MRFTWLFGSLLLLIHTPGALASPLPSNNYTLAVCGDNSLFRDDGFAPLGPPLVPPLQAKDVNDDDAKRVLELTPNNLIGTTGYAKGIMVPLHGMFESVLHSNTREISKQDAALLLTRAAGQMDCEYLWRNWLDVVARLPMPLVGDKYNPELDGSKDKIVKALKLSTKDIKGGKGPWNKEQRLMFTITDELSKDHTTDLEDQKKALDVLGKEATLEVMLIQGMASSYCGIARGMHVALETNTIVADSIRKALVDDIMYV